MMTHFANSVIRRLPPTCFADDQRGVRCVGVKNPRIVCSEEDIIDPKCQAGQDEDARWHDPLRFT